MSEKRTFWRGVVAGMLIAMFITSVVIMMQNRVIPGSDIILGEDEVVNTATTGKLKLIKDIIDRQFCLEMPEYEQMSEGMYRGLVDSLGDKYSAYFTSDEMETVKSSQEGVYYGIGCTVSVDDETGFVRLIEVYPGSPCEEAGLKSGDLLIKVAGQDIKDMELSDVVNLIRGEQKTKVDITAFREGMDDFMELSVERREIPVQTVKLDMYGDFACIRIKEFDTVTIDQFAENLAVAKGREMRGLILDLRDNLGGNLNSCVEIARKLLPEGIIVYTLDKTGDRIDYKCNGDNEIKVPMIVLVNGNTASASEILAGAIKDYGKGYILGTKTFGKGIVQQYTTLSDGSAVKLTSSKYYTPKGNNIHGIGIEPDEVLEADYEKLYVEGVDNQLERAKELLENGWLS